MKKYFALTMALVSVTAVANTNKPVNSHTAEQKPPMMVLTTVDVSGKVMKPLNSRVYSLSKAKTELCWEVFNIPFIAKNRITEVFDTPDTAKFTTTDSSIVSSNDNKTHTIITYQPSINNELIRRCWKFDKTDPLGTYKLTLQVNDVTFPTQTFSVVK
ncbi:MULTISPECIES: pseudouridine synthase [Glaesserella]|uniref:Pseudouridine synthase n=1 Tax=Glaesserella australis TaxID=2094024 RepID=A0A328BZD4_9PAST|nr:MULTISPECIES: pseudouridine synthase [Glaesserella]AUI66070.1 pseudouridine synthase [Glaesserella sp. 15-184]RAL18210.1 pseudouridine synthase [Glaesserella australis]